MKGIHRAYSIVLLGCYLLVGCADRVQVHRTVQPLDTETHIYTNEHLCILRRGQLVVSVFTDGTICYNERGETASCRPAIPRPTIGGTE
jgi:hypothetical protein